MELQKVIDYCSAKKGTNQEFPFDDTTLVFKVLGKIYGLVNLDHPPHSINLKADPIYAISLRQKYNGIRTGYHMNKKHWNTVELDDDVPEDEILSQIDDSYNLIVKGLTKAQHAELDQL